MVVIQLASWLLLISGTLSLTACAASVDTVSVYSACMKKQTSAIVICPSISSVESLPVLYLLHGLGGDYTSWPAIKPELVELSQEYKMLIVCPDGGERSWYIDSPIDSSFRYETYVVKELIPFIDREYKTIANRSGRAIAGLSMGGHGSLFLAIRHNDVFGAACSTSGSVDLLKKTFSWKYKEMILGDTICCKQNWINHSVIHLADQIEPDGLAIRIDCGTEDELYSANLRLHEKLSAMHVEHEYAEGPGKHDAAYWNKSIEPILEFIDSYFRKK